MKKQKILKYLIILVSVILAISLIYNVVKYIRIENQQIYITASQNYYADTNLEAVVEITSKKIIESGKVKVRLLDSQQKKVKGVTEKYKINEEESVNVNLAIPENLEPGKYYLEVTANTNVGKDKVIKPINIQKNKDENINVSLDKGIYKPGDEVNFRALLTYKDNDKPIIEDVNVSIYDGNDNRVYNKSFKTSDYGIISGTFNLADEVNSGTYKLSVTTKNQEYNKYFTVNPYITPKFGVEILTDKENYLLDEKAIITVKSEYFFGEKVKNANVVLELDGNKYNGQTDKNGEYKLEYIAKKVGKINIKTTVVDTSNYMVEETKSIPVGTDLFEIEFLPEYGGIIRNINNQVYIFTKKADGTPIKTYLTVNVGKVTRQVITDENGIGKVQLTSSDISNLFIENNQIEFKISAQDMENNIINKNIGVDFKYNYGTVISTDKVKYDVGEDITLKLNSDSDLEKTIYVSKNNKIIKMITTTDEEIKLNLEDTYGLIDINVIDYNTSNNNIKDGRLVFSDVTPNYNYISNTNSKRTIFIKPDKQLNIALSTDFEEYKPGNTAKLSLELTDKNNSSVDGAMLVSILDEAVLNLASNDISIDNIKLALSDIKFTEDLDAATLYSNIIDDSSETALMGLLLKQKGTNNLVNKELIRSEIYKGEYLRNSILIGLGLIILLAIVGMVKSKKIRNALIHILSILCILVIFLASLADYLYYDLDLSEISVLIVGIIVSIILYVLFFNKNKSYLFKFLLQYSLIIIGAELIWGALNEVLGLGYGETTIFTLLIIPVLYTFIVVIEKNDKKYKKIKEILKSLFKGEIVLIITYLLLRYNFEWPTFIIPVLILDCIYEKFLKNKKLKDFIKLKNKKLEVTGGQLLVIFGIVLLLIVMFVAENNKYGHNISEPHYGGIVIDDALVPGNSGINIDSFTGSASESVESSKGNNNILGDIFNSAGSIMDSANSITQSTENKKEEEFVAEENSSEDTNIRNVFLESLCFIPELVTTNGKAEKEIKLSDNITTWQIQVVGNTKNGEVGYAKDTFKVFKEFFVDFSMPTNSVVGDKVSLPITIYNYTENNLNVSLNIPEAGWFKLGEYSKTINLAAKETKMIYVPIEILAAGENTLRVEAKANELADIIERTMKTEENGVKVSNVVASVTFEDKLELDVLYLQEYKKGTGNLKVKLYSTAMSQAVEGLENIFRMPTGCFEQVSSSLYPDILVLNYLEQTDNINEELKQKALNYIETGYQKILTYEVPSEKGGYSLYGDAPAEIVLTAYGLMEVKDLSEVYEVDEKVLKNMKEYILGKQNINGSFDIDKKYSYGVVNTSNELALNAYIIWALSESFPEEKALEKSVEYLEGKIDEVTDNYTLALMANVFANTNSKKTNAVISKLVKNIKTENNNIAYLTSNIKDYYGSYGRYQNLQTTALTSLALTKTNSNSKTNLKLINHIISGKDTYGTWGTTQATILSLKALVEYEGNTTIKEQEIKVSLNDDNKKIQVEKDNLDIYQVNFGKVDKENKLQIDLEKGKIYYEVIQEYYMDYEKYAKENKLQIDNKIDTNVKVNDVITQNIKISNISEDEIANGMVEISVPQACSVKEESLSKLQSYGVIEKYEYSYDKIYLYLRNFDKNEYVDIQVQYKADYPANVTGGSVRVYDYYNPDIQGLSMPIKIEIK